MKEEFYKYVSNYNLDDDNIRLKYDHSIRVMELSRKYAEILGFSDYDIRLATLIGLLHDIGRFEQLKVYNTFNDDISIDHALYGVQELFDKGIIENFECNKDDYEIIRFAIYNHNKISIEETDDDRKLMHAKLIRDTDKLDILYLMGYYRQLKIVTSEDEISEDVKSAILRHEQVLNSLRKNPNDKVATTLALAFDINNDACLEELKQNINYYYNAIDRKEKFKDIYDEIIKYIDERMKLC